MIKENKIIKTNGCIDCIFSKWWTSFANEEKTLLHDTYFCSLIDNDLPSSEKNNIIELTSLENDNNSLNEFYTLENCPIKNTNITIILNN